jgi:hypothetical protein
VSGGVEVAADAVGAIAGVLTTAVIGVNIVNRGMGGEAAIARLGDLRHLVEIWRRR